MDAYLLRGGFGLSDFGRDEFEEYDEVDEFEFQQGHAGGTNGNKPQISSHSLSNVHEEEPLQSTQGESIDQPSQLLQINDQPGNLQNKTGNEEGENIYPSPPPQLLQNDEVLHTEAQPPPPGHFDLKLAPGEPGLASHPIAINDQNVLQAQPPTLEDILVRLDKTLENNQTFIEKQTQMMDTMSANVMETLSEMFTKFIDNIKTVKIEIPEDVATSMKDIQTFVDVLGRISETINGSVHLHQQQTRHHSAPHNI